MGLDRVKNRNISIDQNSIQDFYKQRALNRKNIDIDAPVVLCGDKDPDKISYWTSYEINHKLRLSQLNGENKVLELGFGTGRIAKYLIQNSKLYVGIDYVKELVDIASSREDIEKNDDTYFLYGSLQELVGGELHLPNVEFDRFVISGGVLMYINDDILHECLKKMLKLFSNKCIMYISEPIAIKERLTLNKFYSDNLGSEYSAIYRTVGEYNNLFSPFYEAGFKMMLNEEFFTEDIKKQKETKQWLFILER